MAANRVNNSNIPPRTAVGYLAMQWSTNGGWAYGTGALIDAQHILTCSHNLVDQLTDPPPHGHAQQVLFYPSYNQQRPANPPPGGLPVELGIFSVDFRNGQDAWDVALCRLQAAVALPPAFYFVPTVTGEEIIGEDVWLTGYPGLSQGEMWEDRDEVGGIHIDTNTMIYTHDTWAGNSGSPTWTYEAVEDVVKQHAIHVSVSGEDDELRRGVLITAAVLNWIQAAQGIVVPPAPGFSLIGIQLV